MATTSKSLEYLERMLNRTTLTTKKLTHGNIIDLGDNVLKKTYIDVDAMKAGAVKMALEEAEIRHKHETEALSERVKEKAEKKQELALSRMKLFYTEQAKRVAEQRDKAEAEKIRQLKKQLEQDKQNALQKQKEEILAETERTIQEAIKASKKQLQKEFALERQRAVAKALAEAKDTYNEKERISLMKTRQECEREAAARAAEVATAHAKEMHLLQQRLSQIKQNLYQVSQEKASLESDFVDLQNEFMRFIDYTGGGKFNSDYLLQTRRFSTSNAKHLAVSMEEVRMLGKP